MPQPVVAYGPELMESWFGRAGGGRSAASPRDRVERVSLLTDKRKNTVGIGLGRMVTL